VAVGQETIEETPGAAASGKGGIGKKLNVFGLGPDRLVEGAVRGTIVKDLGSVSGKWSAQ